MQSLKVRVKVRVRGRVRVRVRVRVRHNNVRGRVKGVIKEWGTEIREGGLSSMKGGPELEGLGPKARE